MSLLRHEGNGSLPMHLSGATWAINSQQKENLTRNFAFMQLQLSEKHNRINAARSGHHLQEIK